MKARMNIRRGQFRSTRFADLASPSCEGWALANGWRNKWSSDGQFELCFGAYGWTKVRVWDDNFEDAFEEACEWLDDNSCLASLLASMLPRLSAISTLRASRPNWPPTGLVHDVCDCVGACWGHEP